MEGLTVKHSGRGERVKSEHHFCQVTLTKRLDAWAPLFLPVLSGGDEAWKGACYVPGMQKALDK